MRPSRKYMAGSILVLLLGASVQFACPGGDAECKEDAECPAGRYCQVGSCSYDCVLDSECPPDYRCTERGRCERGCRRTNEGIEACDGLDNDCDGATDEPFADLGLPCQFGGCPPGLWVCSADGLSVRCDAQEPLEGDFICDAKDDDCDGLTDEDVTAQPCPLQAGVCQGTVSVCLEEGQMSQCEYGPNYTAGVDDVCDGLDNDCDGLTDEDAQVLPMGEFGPQATDGLDNNCNGLIDEPGGVMTVVNGEFAIDVYESTVFADAACSGQRYGHPHNDYPAGFPATGDATVELYACSLPGVFPSRYLSWYRADRVCRAQGKRLCTGAEFEKACIGPDFYRYPYGGAFYSGWCNDGWAEESQLAETGSYPICVSGWGVWDMSGNLGEWVSTNDPDVSGNAFVGGGYYTCYYCQPSGGCAACNRDLDSSKDHIMLSLDCQPGSDAVGHEYDSFAKYRTEAYLGTRCCMDLP